MIHSLTTNIETEDEDRFDIEMDTFLKDENIRVNNLDQQERFLETYNFYLFCSARQLLVDLDSDADLEARDKFDKDLVLMLLTMKIRLEFTDDEWVDFYNYFTETLFSKTAFINSFFTGTDS